MKLKGRLTSFIFRLTGSLGAVAALRLLLLVVMLFSGALPALAEEKFCSDYPNGVLDGFVDPVPVQITIDRDCTFQNFTASNPLTSTLNFHTNDPSIYLIVFNNSIFTGHMACANVDHRIWFANGSDYGSSNSCQDLFIPIESIDKQAPGPVATIGEPFTYTLTFPSMSVVGGPSLNALHSITLWDDLDATGADLTFVSINAYLKSTGQAITLEPETDPTSPNGVWTTKNLSYKPYADILPAGEQLIVEITVVPDNTLENAAGRTFVNTAKWSFGRLIEGDFYEPLPGEWGVSEPMTIAEPSLVVNKSSSETALNLGVPVTFTIDVQNVGGSDAWNTTIVDQFPDGMCDQDPTLAPGFAARIVEANGTTAANLALDTDYTATFGADAACSLNLTMKSDRAVIGPLQHLVLTYQSELDGDIVDDGLNLVNVAGATQWLSADPGSGADYRTFDRTLTDGTPTVTDHQDSQVVTTALSGYYFQKIVENLDSGANPAVAATPGDKLRYRIRLFNVDETINGVTIRDQLDLSRFDLSTFAVTALPAGTAYNFTPGTGLLEISGNPGPLNIPVGGELIVEFEINLLSSLSNGTLVSNQASLAAVGINTVSDDPYVNGISPPDGDPPPDPTVVVIQTPGPLSKSNTRGVGTIGEQFQYIIRVPSIPVDVPMYDIRISDNLIAYGADMRFVSASAVPEGNWALSNIGTATQPVIADAVTGIDIPAGGQAVIEVTVELENSIKNQDGVLFINRAEYTYNRINGNEASRKQGGAASTDNMSVVEPALNAGKEVRFVTPAGKPSSEPGVVGDILEYTVTVNNSGTSTAFDISVIDSLPGDVSLVAGSAAAQIDGVDVAGFQAEPLVNPDGTVVWGQDNGDGSLDIPVGRTLIISYQARIETITSTEIVNNVFVNWTSLDGTSTTERTGAGCPVITSPNDYCVGPATASQSAELDISFVKSVARVTSEGVAPGDNAEPSDILRYTLEVANLGGSPLINATLTDELAPQFLPGSLRILQILDENNAPVDVDITLTDLSGGPNGTGVVVVSDINLAAEGEPNDSLLIIFEATLNPVIQSGVTVSNRAQLVGDNISNVVSNEATTQISSAPAFEIWKTSEDLTGDPENLLAGDTLRYTIRLNNVGNENAVNCILADQIPVNTTYVLGSTTLNGSPVPDTASGISTLQGGLLVSVPDETTPGAMSADPARTSSGNIATVTFDVVVNDDVVDGTIIANQGLLKAEGAGSGRAPDEPSDDPDTAILDDPTRDVVGSLPLVDAHKTVVLVKPDPDADGTVNPGDTLRYFITIVNTGPQPANSVVFRDPIPVYTTFVNGSVRLNGEPVDEQFDGTALTVDVSSPDQPAPVQGAGEGVLPANSSAEITFDVIVNDNPLAGSVPDPGTIISNQGVVSCTEQPDEPTDADGIDTNGDQPTQIVVGDETQLIIRKDVFVVDGTIAEPGQLLEYMIRATNIGVQPATSVVLTDDLGQLTGLASYVDNSASLNGDVGGVSYDGSVLTANYSENYGALPPGGEVVLRFRVRIDGAVAAGTSLGNTGVVLWNDPPHRAEASVSLDVGGTPGSGILNGTVWHDADLDNVNGAAERDLEGWSVDLYRANQLLATVLTDASGIYRLSGLSPEGSPYELRFRAAGAGPNTPSLGQTISPFTNGPQQISDIDVASGSNLQNLDLPISPNGAVYDSVQRTAVSGARVSLLNASSHAPLPGRCFDDPVQQYQVTAANGFYKFDLNFSDPSCPPGAAYLIDLTPPQNGYEDSASQIIAPENDPSQPFSVMSCPGSSDDALPATTSLCEITTSADPPSVSMRPGTAGTRYFLNVVLSNGLMPGQSQAFNNHLPVDPVLNDAVTITKTSSLINVTKGQLVPYTITLANNFSAPLYGLRIIDTFPAGFKYVEGSARLNGSHREPQVVGRQLIWDDVDLAFDERQSLQLLLLVGSGVTEDKYVNQAQAINMATQQAISAVATATVRVVPDPTFDCTDVIGKVFDDRNLDGQQDPGEQGLEGVQVVTARGLVGTTDQAGRFHITCAAIPDQDRGSNFILKLDDRSLPTGYRLTTENPRVQRVTRGKMMKFNFGVTIHRVVGLDFADGVFGPESTELRVQWHPKLKLLIEELRQAPSVLRLSYLADVESKILVQSRIEALHEEITRLWDLANGGYPLTIETEVFWRRGGPQ